MRYGSDGKKMSGSIHGNPTPEPRGWGEIVSEPLEGVDDARYQSESDGRGSLVCVRGGCPTTKKKVAVPYPDDKVRNLGVTSNDWDDILEEFNNGMAGYWSSAACDGGPIALIFLVVFIALILSQFGVFQGRRLQEDQGYGYGGRGPAGDSPTGGGGLPILLSIVAFVVVMAGRTGMKLQNKKHDGKLNNLLTEKVNSRFEARGLLVKLRVQVENGLNGRKTTTRFFCAYIRAAPSTETAVTAGMVQPRMAAQAQPIQVQPMQPLQGYEGEGSCCGVDGKADGCQRCPYNCSIPVRLQ